MIINFSELDYCLPADIYFDRSFSIGPLNLVRINPFKHSVEISLSPLGRADSCLFDAVGGGYKLACLAT